MNVYDQAELICQEVGINFDDQLDYFQNHGYIFQTPSALAMSEIRNYKGEKAWCVFLLVGPESLVYCLRAMPVWCPKIVFARALRMRHTIKSYSTERICKLLKVDPEPLKQRKP